jgi:hypothetical protein
VSDKIPKRGTDEYRWWLAGATAEHNGRFEGMTKDTRELFEAVEVMAQQGDSRDEMTEFVTVVFTCEWPLRKRLRLAWKVATNR